MYKSRSNVVPRCIFLGLVIVCLVLPSELTAAESFAQEAQPQQEAPPQTEEQRQARQALNEGVQNFKNGQYDEAIVTFQRAKLLDPRLMNAQLYLATAYASQYIPGAPSEKNQELGRKAVEEFRGALDIDPQNLSAIDGIGSIIFQMAGTPYDPEKFQESKSYRQKHIALQPKDPEPYYWVGVIDWTLSFRANHEVRAGYNQAHLAHQIKDTEPLPVVVREEYVRKYGSIIDEGIESMKHAIELRPDYDDAMAYLNLLYRRKADAVASPSERDDLLLMADYLVDRVKEIKWKRAEQPRQP
jgi:tetratricopeptide (TPR) repeat protein